MEKAHRSGERRVPDAPERSIRGVTCPGRERPGGAIGEFTDSVKRLIDAELGVIVSLLGDGEASVREGMIDNGLLTPGKMLRTRLAARLACSAARLTPRPWGSSPESEAASAAKAGSSPKSARLAASEAPRIDDPALARYCAAVEMAHTATLCHDDVIDNGLLRRDRPTLWKQSSPSAAVLIGDLLLSRALVIAVGTEGGHLVGEFVSKVQEVCAAEAEQELVLRGRELDDEACIGLARRKTGPLFAFAALVAGRGEAELSAAAAEAGYRIGAAYQVFDDLVDVAGDEREARKTLGTDVARRKFTIPQRPEGGRRAAAGHVERLCAGAVACLERWPRARSGVEAYVERDLKPLFAPFLPSPDGGAAPALPGRSLREVTCPGRERPGGGVAT